MARNAPSSTDLLRPPPPIFVPLSVIGPNVNWFGESILLAHAIIRGALSEAQEIIARHDPRLAQWVPECVHDGLFVAAMESRAAAFDILGPFADLDDAPAMKKILAAAAYRGDEETLGKALLYCVFPRLNRPAAATAR